MHKTCLKSCTCNAWRSTKGAQADVCLSFPIDSDFSCPRSNSFFLFVLFSTSVLFSLSLFCALEEKKHGIRRNEISLSQQELKLSTRRLQQTYYLPPPLALSLSKQGNFFSTPRFPLANSSPDISSVSSELTNALKVQQATGLTRG